MNTEVIEKTAIDKLEEARSEVIGQVTKRLQETDPGLALAFNLLNLFDELAYEDMAVPHQCLVEAKGRFALEVPIDSIKSREEQRADDQQDPADLIRRANEPTINRAQIVSLVGDITASEAWQAIPSGKEGDLFLDIVNLVPGQEIKSRYALTREQLSDLRKLLEQKVQSYGTLPNEEMRSNFLGVLVAGIKRAKQ